MSVTSHLKDLLTKMGGTPKDGDSTSVLIDKIEDVYNGSGSGGGGGSASNNFIVTVYADEAFDNPGNESEVAVVIKLDKTAREIKEAIHAKMPIFFAYETPTMNMTFYGDEDAENNVNLSQIPVFIPHNINSEQLVSRGRMSSGSGEGTKFVVYNSDYNDSRYSPTETDYFSFLLFKDSINMIYIKNADGKYDKNEIGEYDGRFNITCYTNSYVAKGALSSFYFDSLDDYPKHTFVVK